MPLDLSDAELKEIARNLFLLKDPESMKLPKHQNTGPDSFTSRFDSIARDDKFKNMGIGVIDFSESFMNPKIWLNNKSDRAWRIGSTHKLALQLAAVQLRDDVRMLHVNNIVGQDEFDELFQMKKLWGLYRGKGADKEGILQISGKANAPQISIIFDFSKPIVDFTGPPIDSISAIDIFNRLTQNGAHHLTWGEVGKFRFSELLWLAGSMSDNIAATACASLIGLPYIKAVMGAYGLFDPGNSMYLQMSGAPNAEDHDFIKGRVLVDSTKPNGARYRPLTHVQKIARVTDAVKDSNGKFTDQRTWQPGSAAALTTYMIALMQNKLVDPTSFLLPPSARGIVGCSTIRGNLAVEGAFGVKSQLVKGIRDFMAPLPIKMAFCKIGILGPPDGERSILICEFAYLEITLSVNPPMPPEDLKFAVVATGIMGGAHRDPNILSQELGAAVIGVLNR